MKKVIHVAFIADIVAAFIISDGPELQVTWQNNLEAWRELWRFGLR